MYKLANVSDMPPTNRAYWVIPGLFLAGSYPGESDAQLHEMRLQKLWKSGICTIVNLMEPTEKNNSGENFRPYLPFLEHLSHQSQRPIHYHRFHIVDVSVPTKKRMTEILDTIDNSLSRSLPVYVHCFGGIGRTATVVGCWLLRHQLANHTNVLDTIQTLRMADKKTSHRLAPETAQQRNFVTSWLESD